MIFTDILNMCLEGLYWLLEVAFGWINVPSFPDSLSSSIDSFLTLVFENLSLLGFFIRPLTLQIVIPLLIFIINFEFIYKLIMWVARKIPFLNVK